MKSQVYFANCILSTWDMLVPQLSKFLIVFNFILSTATKLKSMH